MSTPSTRQSPATGKTLRESISRPVPSARPLCSNRKADTANERVKVKGDPVTAGQVDNLDHHLSRTPGTYAGAVPGHEFVPTTKSVISISPDQFAGDLNNSCSVPGSQPQQAGRRRLSVVDSDDFHSMLNAAATKIQRWYRTHRHQQHANVVRLLSQKRAELNQSIAESQVRLVRLSQEKERAGQEKQRRKVEKAQEARQAAIATLQKKRDEKRLLAQLAAEEEFVSSTLQQLRCDCTLELQSLAELLRFERPVHLMYFLLH